MFAALDSLIRGSSEGGWEGLPAAPLFRAIYDGDEDDLEEELAGPLRSRVNDLDSDGFGLLHHVALGNGTASMVDTLVQAGANVNLLNSLKETPLKVSVCGRCHDVASRLLFHGASTTSADRSGRTALSTAKDNGDAKMVALLEGAKTNTASTNKKCCNVCGAAATSPASLLLCSRCKSAAYCGPACQKSDWKSHKLICATAPKPAGKPAGSADTTYVGKRLGGMEHGQGSKTYEDGSHYVGEWVAGKEHGKGTKTYKDGSAGYLGDWVDGTENFDGLMRRLEEDKERMEREKTPADKCRDKYQDLAEDYRDYSKTDGIAFTDNDWLSDHIQTKKQYKAIRTMHSIKWIEYNLIKKKILDQQAEQIERCRKTLAVVTEGRDAPGATYEERCFFSGKIEWYAEELRQLKGTSVKYKKDFVEEEKDFETFKAKLAESPLDEDTNPYTAKAFSNIMAGRKQRNLRYTDYGLYGGTGYGQYCGKYDEGVYEDDGGGDEEDDSKEGRKVVRARRPKKGKM